VYNISLSDENIEKLKKKSKEKIKEGLKESEYKLPILKKKINELEDKISAVEEKFILNQLNYETYSKWNTSYNTELNVLKSQLTTSTHKEQDIWDRYKDFTYNLKNLLNLFDSATLPQQQKLLNIVFNYSLKYELNSFVCENILPLFALKLPILKEKGLLNLSNPNPQMDQNRVTSPISTPHGTTIELFELIKTITTNAPLCPFKKTERKRN
jgi:site-specific DNA recombinase